MSSSPYNLSHQGEGEVKREIVSLSPSPPPLIIVTDSDSDSDEIPRVLQVERYWDRARPPPCRRIDGQPPCHQSNNLSCRKAIAVLAMQAGLLSLRSVERNLEVSVPVTPGLSYFTWCTSNLFFRGLVPLAVTFVPPPNPDLAEFFIGSALPGVTWMRVFSSIGPFQPAVRSFVFSSELSMPSLLACFFSGPVPIALLTNPAPPHVNLEACQLANYYFVTII
jgi:hypothetical protein